VPGPADGRVVVFRARRFAVRAARRAPLDLYLPHCVSFLPCWLRWSAADRRGHAFGGRSGRSLHRGGERCLAPWVVHVQPGPRSSPLPLMCLPGRGPARREAGPLPGLQPGRWGGDTGSRWFARPGHRRTDRLWTGVNVLVAGRFCRRLGLHCYAYRWERAWADRRLSAYAVLTGLLDQSALYGVLEVCQLTRTANNQDQVTPANRDGG